VGAEQRPVSGAERIAAAFAAARADGRAAALMPYMMAGYPDLEISTAIGRRYADAGADIVELGIPFSDPLADGPVIHAAAVAALRSGVRVHDALEVARQVSEAVVVVVMCYVNPILAWGFERFADALAERGVSGLIVPDLPFEEAPAAIAACDARGLALVPLVAPTTPEQRLAMIGGRARGFVYAVSVTGTTGERATLDVSLPAVLARVRASTEVPVAVGFGIATPEQASAAAECGADGVIIGTRLVRAAGEGRDAVDATGELVSGFAAALSRDPVG
jgi:tryptophan synthase alpha chain